MAYTVTFADLKTSVLDQADEQGFGFIATVQLERVINRSFARFYGKLVQSAEDDYTERTTIPTVANQEIYALPANFLKLRHLEADLGGVKPIRIRKFNLQERHLLGGTWKLGHAIMYRPIGKDSVSFLPIPTAVHNVEVFFIPAPPILTTGGAVTDYDFRSGWDDWVVWDAVAKIGIQQEQNVADVIALRDDIWKNDIEALISTQDEADTESVQDVEFDHYHDDGSW